RRRRSSGGKHDPSSRSQAVQYCLAVKGLALDDLDFIAFYDKPFIKFERLLETYLAFAPRGYRSFAVALPLGIKEKLFQKSLPPRELKNLGASRRIDDRLLFAEHHQSHAA